MTNSGTVPAGPPRPARRDRWRTGPWPALVVVSAGGVVGSLARYGVQLALPNRPDGFAWATFAVNVTGCLLIGALMTLVTEVWSGRRLLRPFLGVGVLGGFTTFSTYAVDTVAAVAAGAPGTALLYLAGTLAGALTAVWLGATGTGWAVRRRTARRASAGPVPDSTGEEARS